jgi:hypothetical protein
MLEWVLDDLKAQPENVIVVTQKEFGINGPFRKVELNGFTDGPACTAMEAFKHIEPTEELVVVNCDQRILDLNGEEIQKHAKINNLDGTIGVFYSNKPHNSYVNVDQDHLVAYVKEKRVISNLATNGLHYWAKASFFYDSCIEMIQKEDRVNGEFYISQSYNYLIARGYRIGAFHFNMHFPIGVPEDLNNFIRLGV